MRISLVTETFPPEVNGVAHTLATLVRHLAARGHAIEVVCPRQRRSSPHDESPPWITMTVPGLPLPGYSGLRFGLPAFARLTNAWHRDRPDIVHVATEGPLGFAAMAVARAMRIPVLSSFHTNFHLYGRFYGFGMLQRVAVAYLRWFHNRTQQTLAPCPDAVTHLRKDGFKRLAVLGRGIDTDLFSPTRRSPDLRTVWGATPETPVVAYVGRVADEKNLPLFERVMTDLRVHAPTARFLVVGDGPALPALRARWPEMISPGMLRGVDLATHYASADVFLFPSQTETFGNVVLEAMASGLAVVAFDYAAAALHVEDGVSGIRVPLDRDDGFVNASRRLIRTPATARRMGQAAQARVASCSWTRVVDGFEQRLEEASLGGQRRMSSPPDQGESTQGESTRLSQSGP